ncbi:hypothetical protein D3C87_1646960 [compost metagenome]
MTKTSTRNRTLAFEETFESPFEKESEIDALKVLDSIRKSHPESSGWVEEKGYAEQLANGKWRAVRVHKKYK